MQGVQAPARARAAREAAVSGTVRGLIVVENVVEMQQCLLYKHTAHLCAILDRHHVCPDSWWDAAGKPVASPMRALCPTCHANTHAAIDARIKGQNRSHLPPRCVALADAAFPIAEQNGLTPALTL